MPKKNAKLPLSKTHPKLAKEADGWDPNTVTKGTHKKLRWKCANNHRWVAAVNNRSKGRGCPKCYSMNPKRFVSLATASSKLSMQADGWDPSKYGISNSKKMKWKCASGHKWEASIVSRYYGKKSKGTNCPICSGKKVLIGFNDFATTHPEIAREAHNWDPKSVTRGSHKKVMWKCSKHHIWQAVVKDRTRRGDGCPICAGKKIIVGFNDLKNTHPDISLEACGWDPSEFVAGSNKRVEWICKLDHRWIATIASRTGSRKTNCPYCVNQKILTGFNDLKTLHPDLALEAVNWDTGSVGAGSHKKMKWKCSKGHIWLAQVISRTKQKTNCPYCSNIKLLTGYNDLATISPELAKEAHKWDPKLVLSGSHKSVLWKCSKNHIFRAYISQRLLQNTACGFCTNRKVLTGFNDLKTLFPEIALQAYKWNPQKVLAYSHRELKWQCQNKHIWTAPVNRRSSALSGCPECAEYGFNVGKDAWLYLISHQKWKMLQIGITNDLSQRLKKHSRLGWRVIEARGPMDGYLTHQWETAILRMLKAKGADLSNKEIAGKFDGYSEAWSQSTFPATSIKELMRLAEEFELGN